MRSVSSLRSKVTSGFERLKGDFELVSLSEGKFLGPTPFLVVGLIHHGRKSKDSGSQAAHTAMCGLWLRWDFAAGRASGMLRSLRL